MEAVKTEAAPSFETVWAILQEVGKKHEEHAEAMKKLRESQEKLKESQEETNRQRKESQQEHAEAMKKLRESQEKLKESQEETNRQMRKSERQFNKRFGVYDNRFGKVVEHMIKPKLCEKFRELGFEFTKANNTKITDYVNNIFLEIDVMLENGRDNVMLVEIKTQLTAEHAKDHINRLEKMRIYADLHGDKRKFLGAIAAVIAPPNEKKYALEQGFFVIEPSGETFNITPPPYQPKEW